MGFENYKIEKCKSIKSVQTGKAVRKYLFLLSIIGVQLVFFCVFYIGINFNSILMAFQKFKVDGTVIMTLDNFRLFFDNLSNADEIGVALRNTLIFFVLGLVLLPVSFTSSYFLYKKVYGYRMIRIVFFLPSILSPVVWTNIYTLVVGTEGPIAALFKTLAGLRFSPNFLADSHYAIIFVVLYSFWLGFASNFVLFSGTLSRIPESVIEAGKIDGLGWFGELTRIIIPLVWPTLSTMVIMSLTTIFTSSGNILLLTNGNYNTQTISFLIFQNVYTGGNGGYSGTIGYAAAVGLVFTVLTLPMVLLSVKLLNKVEDVKY